MSVNANQKNTRSPWVVSSSVHACKDSVLTLFQDIFLVWGFGESPNLKTRLTQYMRQLGLHIPIAKPPNAYVLRSYPLSVIDCRTIVVKNLLFSSPSSRSDNVCVKSQTQSVFDSAKPILAFLWETIWSTGAFSGREVNPSGLFVLFYSYCMHST